jgi:hypothetical protein
VYELPTLALFSLSPLETLRVGSCPLICFPVEMLNARRAYDSYFPAALLIVRRAHDISFSVELSCSICHKNFILIRVYMSILKQIVVS